MESLFLEWYHGALIGHGARVMDAATAIFATKYKPKTLPPEPKPVSGMLTLTLDGAWCVMCVCPCPRVYVCVCVCLHVRVRACVCAGWMCVSAHLRTPV